MGIVGQTNQEGINHEQPDPTEVIHGRTRTNIPVYSYGESIRRRYSEQLHGVPGIRHEPQYYMVGCLRR